MIRCSKPLTLRSSEKKCDTEFSLCKTGHADLSRYFCRCVNTLLQNKILELTKLKAFADDKLNVAKMMISLHYFVENILGKRHDAGNQHFLLFPHCFQKAFSIGVVKSRDCVVKG